MGESVEGARVWLVNGVNVGWWVDGWGGCEGGWGCGVEWILWGVGGWSEAVGWVGGGVGLGWVGFGWLG